MTPKKGYNFMIDPELAEGLKVLKQRDGASEGESIRRAIAAYLKRKGVMGPERKRAATRKRP
jgi:hypothetical protein|tara:strand:+ start:654 stop:839 length:186 start_codon:yes stop_codon:yes gene_type:complete